MWVEVATVVRKRQWSVVLMHYRKYEAQRRRKMQDLNKKKLQVNVGDKPVEK